MNRMKAICSLHEEKAKYNKNCMKRGYHAVEKENSFKKQYKTRVGKSRNTNLLLFGLLERI